VKLPSSIIAIIFLVVTPLVAHANSTGDEIIQNYTGIIVLNNGAINPLPVQASYIITGLTPGRAGTSIYRVGFRLIDAGGATVAGEVFSPSFGVLADLIGVFSGSQTASLAPAVPTGGAPYRVSAQLYAQKTITPNLP
jgi:hypothetical protein